MNLRRTNIEQDKDMTQTNDTHTEDEHKLLSIRIGTDGFSFAIVMADDGEHTDMRHHAIDDTLPLTANIKHCSLRKKHCAKAASAARTSCWRANASAFSRPSSLNGTKPAGCSTTTTPSKRTNACCTTRCLTQA